MGGSGAQRNPWLYVGDIWVCVGLVQATQSQPIDRGQFGWEPPLPANSSQ
jgi:hypothetical protein